MGHGLNSVLCDNKLQHFFGARGALDIVELPSHILERICTDRAVVEELVACSQAGSAADAAVRTIMFQRSFCSSLRRLQSLAMAKIDLALHGSSPPASVDELRAAVQAASPTVPGFPTPDFAYLHLSLHHVLAYPGNYYAYAYASAIAELVWQRHFEQDSHNRIAGQVLVDQVLRPGGALNVNAALSTLVPGSVVAVADGFCPGDV